MKREKQEEILKEVLEGKEMYLEELSLKLKERKFADLGGSKGKKELRTLLEKHFSKLV